MKNTKGLWICLCLAACFCLAVTVSAGTYGDLTYVISNGEVTITACDDSASGTVTIPDTLDGCPVTAIGDDAFVNCMDLVGVEIPDTVTCIGDYAFYECNELVSLDLPSSLTRIGDSAFENCVNLTALEIPASVTQIGDYAFAGCEGLISVTFEEGSECAGIGEGAFSGCIDLETIVIQSAECEICDSGDTIPEQAVIYGYTGSTAESYANKYGRSFTALNSPYQNYGYLTYTVSDGEALIVRCDREANGALTIPDTLDGCPVTAIAANAFDTCSAITRITIPSTVTAIGDMAFVACRSLSAVDMPSALTSIGESAFASCQSLGGITIPSGVTTIGPLAFENCTNLSRVTLPASLTTLGEAAFDECSSLLSITIPASLTAIDSTTFYQCTSLSQVTFAAGSRCTRIGDYAFYGCLNLRGIALPSSVTAIEDAAFAACTNLSSVTLSSSLQTLGQSAFYNCTSLGSIVFPSTLTEIPNDAFRNCTALTSMSFASGSQCARIGQNAFFNCRDLESVEIPSSVTSIDLWAFAYDESLTAVDIPASVTGISEGIFLGCTGLTRITVDPANPVYASDAQGVLYYKSSGANAVLLCCPGAATACTIPDSVLILPARAFQDCVNISRVSVPSSVYQIGAVTFAGCESLQSVAVWNANCDIYDSAETIPEGVILYGVAGSTLESYANKYNRTFSTCDHTAFGEWIPDTAPTCTTDGYGTHECAVCGKPVSGVIPANGHTPETIPGTPATCTATGLTDGSKCSVCETILVAQEVVPMAEHTPETIPGTPATCTESGLTDGSKCSVCEAILVAQEVIPMAEHTPETIPGTPATCTESGLTDGSKCSVCETILVAQEVIPATGEHDYVKGELAAPTMEKDAFYTYTCSVCGDSYEETVAPTGANITLTQQVQVGAEYKIAIGVPKVPTGTTAHWVVFTQNTYDPEAPVIETVVSAATSTRVFYSPGIPAPRMNDSLTARYYRITNGVKYVSNVTKSCNLVDYYNGRVAAGADAKLIEALEAMLNYGSAAQLNFGYNTEEILGDEHSGLVNRHIPEANRKSLKADFEDIEATHALVKAGDTTGKGLTYYSMGGQVEQRISLVLAYKRVDKTLDKSTLTFRGSYMNLAGEETEVEISGENFVTSGKNYFTVYLNTIPAKDLRCMITGAIYDSTDTQVSDTITTSLESYVVGVLNGGSDNLKAVCLATLGYSDAIAAYVNK